jgi:protein gp37
MADNTGIEWTQATWNPIAGCSILSKGCTNCYAMKMAARLEAMGQAKYAGLTQPSKAGPVWTGKIAVADDRAFTQPLRWKRGRRIFVNSMSDLFHEDVPDDVIDKVSAIMALAPQHTFQVLTKRPERMRSYMVNDGLGRLSSWCVAAIKMGRAGALVGRHGFPAPNVWLGVSVEDQATADARIPILLDTPAAVRWISAEPLLEDVDLRPWLSGLDWVVAGGESGPDARPMHPDWIRSIRDQCAAAGVPFLFKQWGEWREFDNGSKPGEPHDEMDVGSEIADAYFYAAINPGFVATDGRLFKGGQAGRRSLPPDTPCRLIERVGKKAAGRTLDGRTHDDYPRSA